jgi:hypothetical protein
MGIMFFDLSNPRGRRHPPPNPLMQPTNAGGPKLLANPSLLEALRTISCHKSFAAD